MNHICELLLQEFDLLMKELLGAEARSLSVKNKQQNLCCQILSAVNSEEKYSR